MIVLFIYITIVMINIAWVNLLKVYDDGKKDVGLFDFDRALLGVYLFGPIGTLGLLIGTLIAIGSYICDLKAPEWLRKFNPKIS